MSKMGIQLKKIEKRLKDTVSDLEIEVMDIEKAGEVERKEKVRGISSVIFDLSEVLQDINLNFDAILGDDLLNVEEEEILEGLDSVDVCTALIINVEKHLKNFHKVYYDKTSNQELRAIASSDFERAWRALYKTLKRISKILAGVISKV